MFEFHRCTFQNVWILNSWHWSVMWFPLCDIDSEPAAETWAALSYFKRLSLFSLPPIVENWRRLTGPEHLPPAGGANRIHSFYDENHLCPFSCSDFASLLPSVSHSRGCKLVDLCQPCTGQRKAASVWFPHYNTTWAFIYSNVNTSAPFTPAERFWKHCRYLTLMFFYCFVDLHWFHVRFHVCTRRELPAPVWLMSSVSVASAVCMCEAQRMHTVNTSLCCGSRPHHIWNPCCFSLWSHVKVEEMTSGGDSTSRSVDICVRASGQWWNMERIPAGRREARTQPVNTDSLKLPLFLPTHTYTHIHTHNIGFSPPRLLPHIRFWPFPGTWYHTVWRTVRTWWSGVKVRVLYIFTGGCWLVSGAITWLQSLWRSRSRGPSQTGAVALCLITTWQPLGFPLFF